MHTCPLCQRNVEKVSDHHLIPKCRGGKPENTIPICLDCHHAIHSFFSNKQLEDEYNTADSLLNHEKFNKQIKWISKQDPNKRFKTKLTKEQKRRGRNS